MSKSAIYGIDVKLKKRSGQALLISVLLMIGAALLAATFVTVVARNLEKTAANSAKAEAERALQAGLSYARLQLQTQGLSWRPKNAAPPPQPGDSSFAWYYSDFDGAQGWQTSGAAQTDARYHSDGFVRFPDPRAPVVEESLPFMLKVERIENGDADNSNNARTGDLRIAVIGRSSRSITAFARAIIYQQGAARNPLTSALRVVSNWDFENEVVPWARVKSVSGNTVTLENGAGDFPSGNFTVTIGDAFGSRGVRGAVVETHTSSTRSLKLAAAISPSPQIGERVEMAASLGWQNAIDFDNDGALNLAREAVVWNLIAPNSAASSGGVRVNGGLILHGDMRAALRSSQIANSVSSTIRASGLIQLANAPLSAAPSSANLDIEYSNGQSQNLALLPSDNRSFPFAQSSLTASQKAETVDDGANRIAGNLDATRDVTSFEPPKIDGEGARNRYRLLSQNSPPTNANDAASASLYGYGQGIYLNNIQDREKVLQNGKLREMTPDELRILWTSHLTAPNFLRLATPARRTGSDAGKSLEEQHLRGWIAPDEFRARGALLEINADDTLTITLDSRDDGLAFSLGTAPHKGWRDANGRLLGDASAGGVYRQTFAWPQNGVVFAEGNLRVRGTATNPPRSLTIVSQNNIYIEGSLHAGAKKIALLARKNVVVNPTRVLERPDDQTLLRVAVTRFPATQLQVFDASGFRAGDWIFVDNPASSTEQDVCVASVDAINNVIYLNAATPLTSTTSQPVLRAVRSKSDPIQNSGVPFNRYNRLERFGHVLQRRFAWSGNGEVRLALRHSGERKAALRVPYIDGLNAPTSTRLAHKLAANVATSLIHSDEKAVTVEIDNQQSPDKWEINRPLPPNVKATQYDLNWLGGTNGALRLSHAAPNWRYADPTTPLIFNDYGIAPANSSQPQVPPFYFLAAVGNRQDLIDLPTPTPTPPGPFRQNVKPRGANGFDIPMATSVISTLNGRFSNVGTPNIRSDVWNAAASDWERVGQFGFNPIHGATSPDVNSTDETEDVTTVDSSFYAPYVSSPVVPQWFLNDSRVLDGAQVGANNIALRFNNRRVEGVYAVENYFNATTGNGQMPFYNLARLKLENLGFNGAREVETMSPGATLEIRAFVYAQEGSWWVLPSDFFDASARNNSDQNRDGFISRGEQIAALRFARQNTQIRFRGAICENRTPIVNNVGAVNGAVADWTNKWANISLTASNFGAAYLNNANVANGNYRAIEYSFDEDVARGLFDEDSGFHLPLPPPRGTL